MEKAQTIGYIHSLESFGSADGPGIRFVIFLSGCQMRCKYCHNPDTWKRRAGKRYTAEELLNRALRYRPYWGKEGGITVSGGEPLLQMKFLTELFRLAKAAGVTTAFDTAGGPFRDTKEYLGRFDELLKYTDLVLLDLKHIDENKHKELTGVFNKQVLDMARYLSDCGKSMWIRHVLVPGYTDQEEELQRMNAFIKTLPTVERVEVLPYHALGAFKWAELGLEYQLDGVLPPTNEELEKARAILCSQ